MERISLCMIVKNEEDFLEACLEHVRDLVAEIVIVDTGSTDRTVAIAEAAGAQILHTPWNDDFAAARNVALDAATGTHILSLDADEVLPRSAHESVRLAVQNPELAVAVLPLYSAKRLDVDAEECLAELAGTNPILVPRLFLNHPELRFRGRVHELIFTDHLELQRKTGRRCMQLLQAPIVHYGAIKEVRETRDKFERNTRLMQVALTDEPDNHYLAGQLASEYYAAGRKDEAETLCRKYLPLALEALERIEREEPNRPDRPWPVRLASILTLIQLGRREWHGALDVIQSLQRLIPTPHPNLVYTEAYALERLGHWHAAKSRYETCLTLGGKAYNESIYDGACADGSYARLAHVHLALGRPEDALRSLEHVRPERPASAVSRMLAQAEAEAALGRPADALETLLPLARARLPRPEVYALLGAALEAAGQDGSKMREHARTLPQELWGETRLAYLAYSDAELKDLEDRLGSRPEFVSAA